VSSDFVSLDERLEEIGRLPENTAGERASLHGRLEENDLRDTDVLFFFFFIFPFYSRLIEISLLIEILSL